MPEPVRRVVIVGGGSAGWMTAAYLTRAFGRRIDVQLVESPTVGTIGVGEATFSTIRLFFEFLGLEEKDWMPHCDATYKLAIRFVNWNAQQTDFYHPFQRLEVASGFTASEWWLKLMPDAPFDRNCFVVPDLCERKLSPRFLDGRVYDTTFEKWMERQAAPEKNVLENLRVQYPYAYHFNAGLLANYLRDYAIERGARQILDDVEEVKLRDDGAIDHLMLREHGALEGDLFIDCTGFRGLLINRALGEPFVSFAESLPCDRAIAMQIPRDTARDGINPYTTSTALSSGWVWNIPLYRRDGTGYVYSSAFTSPEDAEREFRQHLGPAGDDAKALHITMRIGRNERSWVRNCVAIGLSSGFVEPLESTGIFFIQHAIEQLVTHFPNSTFNERVITAYNTAVAQCIDGVRDFLTLHYFASSRADTPFWRATKTEIKVSDALRQRLELWKIKSPTNRTIPTAFHGFEAYSYSVMLLGLGYRPVHSNPALDHVDPSDAERMFVKLRSRTKELVSTLPSQFDYLTQMHGRVGAETLVGGSR
ncbi:MAG: Tryptophan halogenase [Gemmatimonadetes bacterium]|nr:Tryptophan halogenase [Gemmatimonadota bacterium]